jgi:hypothetical protein
MNKEIIYIDAEDDITAVIGKIKASNEKIVALVPPKRTGILQSAVNLRLLSKIATKSDKKLVLVTNNKALIALSAAAKIPHAKNLQSKPEMAEIAALEVDDGEDIIDGANLPIGELAKTADIKDDKSIEKDIDSIDIDDDKQDYVPAKPGTPAGSSSKSRVKVPNFSKFRKKLFLIAGGAILLIAFLVWAIWFAPSAKIIISAKTEAAPVSEAINLGGTSPTDIDKNTIQSITKTVKKDVSVDFTATGKRDDGTKASGNITLYIVNPLELTIVPAGTRVFSEGKTYITQEDISIDTPAFDGHGSVKGSGPIQASANGDDYNMPSGADFTVSGYSNITGIGSTISGGTSKMSTIVTASDVQKAKQTLVDQSTDSVKLELQNQFDNGEIIISDSFNADMSDAVSSPAVGEAVSGSKAKLTSATTFGMTAISKSEMESYLRNSIEKQIDDKNMQRIYDTGIDKVKLSGYEKSDKGNATVNIEATGQIGPNIDKQKVKDDSKGKHYGDVQAQLEGIKGVESADIKFSYFWVTTVPKDDNKIQVEFEVSNA